MRMDGRMDEQIERTMPIAAFRNFVEEPENINIY
jgi:hypothetical protein